MDTCATCQSELAPQWNFCVHCGTPVPVRTIPADVPNLTAVFDTTSVSAVPDTPAPDGEDPGLIPAAIRPEPSLSHPRWQPHTRRQFDPRLAFGVTMAAIGLLVVLYAVISLLGSRG
ncbi:MAG: zinc ribbon domain-containing protein [Terrimesophilobacter sp.]